MGLKRRREGERLIGRYIRASDKKVLEKVKLSTFSFDEIRSTAVASLDNINLNVMRADLHTDDEIQSVVREHDSINLELRNSESIRPLLRPIDFTHEWRAIKERASKKRNMKMDDDDEFEFEMALESMRGAEAPSEQSAEPESDDELASEAIPVSEEESHGDEPAFKFKQENVDGEIDGLGEQINLIGSDLDSGVNELSSNYKKIDETQSLEASEELIKESESSDEENSSEFIPVDMKDTDSFDESEKQAAEQYKSQINIEKEYARQLEEAMNEAKARGYEEGFAHGEEKAAIQVQQNATEVVNNLGQVVSELEGLKKSILENSQENFYEIAQAVAESLVRREFSVNPKTFADVLRKAIDDLVPSDDIKIAVHPDTFSRLMGIDIDGLKDSLIKDENIKPGDFRIESNLSVVDGNVKDMIRELLEQADLDIFDAKDDKAG